jgi:hypothetical protein
MPASSNGGWTRAAALAAALAVVAAACGARATRPRPSPQGPAVIVQAAPVAPGARSAGSAGSVTVPASPAVAPVECGPVPDAGGALVETFVRRRGGCVAADALVGYRCGPRLDPVLLVGAGGTRQAAYLGGRFATPLEAMPDGARVVGVGPDGSVVAAGGDPLGSGAGGSAALYVRTGGAVVRWLRLPATPPPQPAAFFLGDSVMLGARPWLLDALPGWSVTFDAKVDRSTWEGLSVARAHRYDVGPVAVVQLGTNDGALPAPFGQRVGEILGQLQGADLVVWLTIEESRSYYVDDNRLIRAVVGGFPNAVVADWASAAPPGGTVDGLHVTTTGARAMAGLVSGYLGSWWDAANGRGDTRCRRTVERAVAGRAFHPPS